MDYQLDTRDYRCPLPLLMVKKALAQLAQDDSLLVLMSAESQVQEFQLLCETLNCDCHLNEDQTLTIRKREACLS